MNWKEISQQQNLELSKELLERQGRINELTAEVRLLREQRASTLAICATYNRADQPVAWQLARKVEAAYAPADLPCPAGCPHPYRSHGPDGCLARTGGHCDVCPCTATGTRTPDRQTEEQP